jgi:hypothetical protein
MNVKRLKAIGKLGVLFGAPLALVLGLFGSGVYYGAKYRPELLGFERDWLGLDVQVPERPASDGPSEGPEKPTGEAAPGDDDGANPSGEDPPKPDSPPVRETPTPKPSEPQEPATTSVAPVELPETRAEPLEGDLAERFGLPITTHVKVLVAPELIDVQPEWIDYVQRTVSQASRIYSKQFGIELELVGINRWPIATEGLSAQALLEDLEHRSREGADVLLGFTLDSVERIPRSSDADESPFNRAYAVVPATSGTERSRHDAHLRTTLREVGRMFGARTIVDPEDPQWQAGSWMSHAVVAEGQAPWIDGGNRRRILERKDKPFEPEKP